MNTVVPFFSYCFTVYAPPVTIGSLSCGRYVLSAAPPFCFFSSGSQMCRGTIGTPAMSVSAFATGAEYLTTSGVGVGAVAFVAWLRDEAMTAVAPLAYLIVVLIVHAAS